MIKHIVMWQLLPEALGKSRNENALQAKALLEGLKGKVPEIIDLEIGINVPDLPENNHLVLVLTVADMAALQRYQDHPEHKKAAAFIGQIRASRAAVDFVTGA